MSNIRLAVFPEDHPIDKIRKEIELFKDGGYQEVSLDQIGEILRDDPEYLDMIESRMIYDGDSVIYQDLGSRRSVIFYNLEE